MHMPDDVAHAIRFVLRVSAMIGEGCRVPDGPRRPDQRMAKITWAKRR